jgi:antitoxin MazE
MKTTIIAIGNSRGVRIPKPLLEESGLVKDVEIYAKNGEIRIVSAGKLKHKADNLQSDIDEFFAEYKDVLEKLAKR